MFMIVNSDGKRVYAGRGGLNKPEADSSVRERNERAEKWGLKVRYAVAPYEDAPES